MKRKLLGFLDLTPEELRMMKSAELYDTKGYCCAQTSPTKKECRQNVKDFREVGVRVGLYKVFLEEVE